MKDKLVKLYLNIFNLVYPTEIEFPLPVLNIITKLVIFFFFFFHRRFSWGPTHNRRIKKFRVYSSEMVKPPGLGN